MKRFRTIAVLAMSIFMIVGSMSVFAAPYNFKLTVSAGNGTPGTLLEGTTASIDPAGSKVTVNGTDTAIKPPSDKHLVIGYKIAGHDNSEILPANTTIDVNDPTSYVHDKDVDLVVAYALESDIVKYQVRYVNEAGTDILPIETHYGANGTRQVVSFKHVEGYLPDAYNRIGTLQKGATTVFTFIYSPVPEGAPNVVVVPGGGAAAAGAGAAGGAAGAAGAGAAGAGGAVGAGGAAGAAIADGAVPAAGPADVVDIDNGGTPTTDTPDGTTAIDDNKTPKASTNWGLIGGGAAVVAAIAAAALAIARRRRDEETEE